MPVSIQRVFIGVLFVLIAALQIRETVTAVQLISHPSAFAGIPDLKPTTLEYYEPGRASRAAGVKRGDVMVAVDGEPIHSRAQEARIFSRHRSGDILTLTLRRGKSPPFDLKYVVTASSFDPSAVLTLIVLNIVTPWSCILLGFLVAFRRPGEPITWPLLCLLICVSQSFRGYSDPPYTWDLAFSWPALFFGDFAVSGMAVAWMWFAIQFPDPKSPNRVWPWTRYALGLPFIAFEALGSVWFATSVHDPKALAWLSPITRFPDWADRAWGVTLILIGCVNLASKLRGETNPSMRRRLRWLVLGLVGGICPLVGLAVVAGALGRDLNSFPLPILLWALLSPFLIPLTLAYALLVDRLLDVGVFVRQGLLASKTVGAIRFVFMAVLIYVAIVIELRPGRTGPARIAELVACAAGIVLTRRGAEWLRKWVDRHFFQEAVNREHLLIELSGEVRGIREPETLLRTVTDRIGSAMHVTRVAALMPNAVSFVPACAFGGTGSPPVPFDDPVVAQLRDSRRPLPRADELLVPILTGGELHGILSLGPKRSEEPYSGRDVALLESVAGQTAVALENTRLTAAVAQEAAHRERITSELEIARTVQDRLFPKSAPKVPGLDLAGFCRPAQTVGGDYYDFFSTPSGATGFAIGDIAGKGVPAALLMASLQASLRGLTLAGISDLAELMEKLNILMYDASPANRFATFFCCLYDPNTRRLRYSSAGHNPALLWCAGSKQTAWLKTRGPALGLRRVSAYEQAEVLLEPGDCLLLYTDGVTEARNAAGEEFEEPRLAEAVLGMSPCRAHEVLTTLMIGIDAFAGSATQHDDITMIAAVCGQRA